MLIAVKELTEYNARYMELCILTDGLFVLYLQGTDPRFLLA